MHRYPIGFAGSARGRHRTRRPRLAGVLALGVSVVLGAGSVAVRADPVAAAGYDNTNPAVTPCANDALTLRNFYVAYSGLIYAELQIRWSPSCKTVWTRTVNRTGHGAGYATARSLTSDEEIIVYNCTETSCMTHYEKETGDVLPSMDSTGFSHQFVIPAPGTAGSPPAPQPPTVRGIVWITWSGHSTPVPLDTNLEPLWTWEANGFKNERNLRVNNTVMTCDNSLSRCALGNPTMFYYIDPYTVPTVLFNDLTSTILPAFSQVNGTPWLLTCSTPCGEDVTIHAEAPGGTHIGQGVGITQDQTYTSGTPAYFIHQNIWYRNAYRTNVNWAHACAEGCSGDNNDDRPMLAHELGHTVGLGHCDTNAGMSVMCAARSINATAQGELSFDGNHYWHPRSADLQAFGLMY